MDAWRDRKIKRKEDDGEKGSKRIRRKTKKTFNDKTPRAEKK